MAGAAHAVLEVERAQPHPWPAAFHHSRHSLSSSSSEETLMGRPMLPAGEPGPQLQPLQPELQPELRPEPQPEPQPTWTLPAGATLPCCLRPCSALPFSQQPPPQNSGSIFPAIRYYTVPEWPSHAYLVGIHWGQEASAWWGLSTHLPPSGLQGVHVVIRRRDRLEDALRDFANHRLNRGRAVTPRFFHWL